MASEKLLKDSIDSILSLHHELFPRLDEAVISFFTSEEVEAIKLKVKAYQANNLSREGGAYLIKELQFVHNFKEGLFNHIENIRQVLKPKEVSRTTVKEAEAFATERSIKNVAATLEGQDEKILRQFGQMLLGDAQIEYTKEELPLVIAHIQIVSILLHPGKVF